MMSCNAYDGLDADAETYFQVGRRFLYGDGLAQDTEKARQLLAQAAGMGHGQAATLLGEMDSRKEESPSAQMDEVERMLEHNRRFVQERDYEKYVTSKYPDRKVAIVTCMDTRLVELLPAALGIKNGDVKIIKNAGGTITNPFDSTVRSLLVAIYELGVNEIMVIGHTGCGVQGMDGKEMLSLMRERGISEEHISLMGHCGIDLESWLHGFDDTAKAVLETVDLIANHPLVPKDVRTRGFIMDSVTGELSAL